MYRKRTLRFIPICLLGFILFTAVATTNLTQPSPKIASPFGTG